jgi:hypothetical protein
LKLCSSEEVKRKDDIVGFPVFLEPSASADDMRYGYAYEMAIFVHICYDFSGQLFHAFIYSIILVLMKLIF